MKIHPHLDTFLVQRKAFWQADGYDERLRQFYFNGPWYQFRRRLNRVAKKRIAEDMFIIFIKSLYNSSKDKNQTTFKGRLGGQLKHLQFNWSKVELNQLV